MGKGICFTGRRPEKIIVPYSEDAEVIKQIKVELTNAIGQAIKAGYDTFYSGVSRGIDIIAAEIVLTFRSTNPHIRLASVIPFEDQPKGWEQEWKVRYNKILINSDEKLVLSDEYYKGCYYDRNKFMVENSECVIAVYKDLKGGTGQTVRFAKENGVRIVHIFL